METVDIIHYKDLWNMKDSIDRFNDSFKDRFKLEEFRDSFAGCFKEFLLHFKLVFISILKSTKYQLFKGQLKNSSTSKLELFATTADGFNLLTIAAKNSWCFLWNNKC